MNIKHQLWNLFGSSIFGLKLIDLYVKTKNVDIGIVKRTVEIVIEGFPRSGNTVAVAAFRIAQKHPIEIAHHVHGVAQVKLAHRFKIPSIVLIRNPVDSVVSLCIRDNRITLDQGIKNYIKFYKKIEPYKNHYVLAQFNDILQNYDDVIKNVNEKYKTNFKIFGEPIKNSLVVRKEVEIMDKKDNKKNSINIFKISLPNSQKEFLKTNYISIIHKDKKLLKNFEIAHKIMDKMISIP